MEKTKLKEWFDSDFIGIKLEKYKKKAEQQSELELGYKFILFPMQHTEWLQQLMAFPLHSPLLRESWLVSNAHGLAFILKHSQSERHCIEASLQEGPRSLHLQAGDLVGVSPLLRESWLVSFLRLVICLVICLNSAGKNGIYLN